MLEYTVQNPPKAYVYDPETYEYLGIDECQIDPLETEKQGGLVWLDPANTTRKAPPAASEGYARIYAPQSDKWDYVEDHREQEYWLPNEGDNWQSEPRVMKELGPLPDSAVTERPAKTPAEIEAENWEMLRSMRDMKLYETDYLLMPDYPISEASLTAVKAYRQALRDLPEQAGAPWDGGGEKTPWPVMPEI